MFTEQQIQGKTTPHWYVAQCIVASFNVSGTGCPESVQRCDQKIIQVFWRASSVGETRIKAPRRTRLLTHPCFSLSYAFPGVVQITLLQRWTERVWIWGLLETCPIPVSVVLLSAGFGGPRFPHRLLAGDASSTHASSLWSASPVCSCQCE